MINAAITIIYSPKTMFHVVHPCLVFLPRRPPVRRPLDLPRARPESATSPPLRRISVGRTVYAERKVKRRKKEEGADPEAVPRAARA